ncbi:helix-turn-helix domain-containing protein [Micromonosporaceae bacterium B7E4]
MTEAPYAELGTALRRCRRLAGLSLRVLARRLGLRAHSALSDYEHGRRLPPEDLLYRYERVFPEHAATLRRKWREALAARADGESATDAAPAGPAESPPAGPRPAQLPADLADFVGRDDDLAVLSTAAARTPAVLVVSGAPGVGKTSLAVHLAHLLAPDFPDGQLFVDLRGADERPVAPAVALGQWVRALGVADAVAPNGDAELAGWYRSLLAGRRMLVLVDNAATEAQVRPLLPGSAEVLVIVTSRNPLMGLDGTLHHPVGPLSEQDTTALLGEIVGAARIAAEPAAATEIARHCAGLPLATRIAGRRLVAWSGWRLRDCAEALADRHQRLDWLAGGDRAVRSTFDMSYRILPADARRLFRRLALLPVPECTVPAAAALTRTAPSVAERLLHSVEQAGMVQPGTAPGRYRIHDLLALYARERLIAEEEPDQRRGAEEDLLGWLLGTTAEMAARLALDDTAGGAPPNGRRRTANHASQQQAIRWLEAERAAILGGVRRAAALNHADLVHPLVPLLPWFYDLRCHWRDLRELARTALGLARRQGAAVPTAAALNALALAWYQLRRPAAALRCASEAARVARGAGTVEEAWALDRMGMALSELGRYAQAATVLRRAAALAHEYGDWWEEAAALNHLGHVLIRADGSAQALREYGRALRIFQALGSTGSEAMTRVGLGRALTHTGRTVDAIDQHHAAIRLFTEVDDGWGAAYARHELAIAVRGTGRLHDAAKLLDQAAAAFGALGDRRHEAASRRALDDLAAVTGAGGGWPG